MCKSMISRIAAALPLGMLAIVAGTQPAHAQGYMMMQYSDNVRIVLSDIPCAEGQGWRAAAQRIDNQYMRACWTREPHDKLVRIQWEGGDFSVFDVDKFHKVEASQTP